MTLWEWLSWGAVAKLMALWFFCVFVWYFLRELFS